MLSGMRFGNRYKGNVHLVPWKKAVSAVPSELFLTNVPPRRLRAANRQSYPLGRAIHGNTKSLLKSALRRCTQQQKLNFLSCSLSAVNV